MTPNAKWVQFNNDESTYSGNGWTRHSYGSFLYEDGVLTIDTENGTEDEFGGFDVEMEGEEMKWTREENGEPVTVRLTRIEKLPTAYADELYGLWDLKEGNGDFAGLVVRDANFYFGTDRILRIRTEGGLDRAVYRVDAHRRMVEWFPYDESQPRRRFEFTDSSDGELILTDEEGTRLVFERTR